MLTSNRIWTLVSLGVIASLLLTACAAPTPQVIKEKVVQTVVVEKEVPVEKVVKETVPVEKVVEKPVEKVIEKEKVVVVTPTPVPTPEPTPLPPPPGMKNPGTMVVATIGDIETMDPAYAYDTASAELQLNVYETLLFYKREKFDEFVPVLAESWEISPDGRTYTFHIRKGVKFHEGGDLTPEDVAYSVVRGLLQDRSGGPQWVLLEPLLGVSSIEDLAMEIAGVDSFEEVDEASLVETCKRAKAAVTFDNDAWTVTFHLPEPFGPFLQILASGWGSVLDKEWVAEIGGWDGSCETWVKYHDPAAEESVLFDKMNGTGPFKLERWVPGEEWSIVRNENYWRTEPIWEGGPSGPPALERVVNKVVPEWGTRFAMFQAGDADLIYVPRQYVEQIDPFVKEEYEGGEADPAKLTIRNPNGFVRLFKNLPAVSAADGFFNQNVNTEGGNPYIGSGELDGNGVPPDFFSDIHLRKAFCYAFDYQTFINDVWLGEAIQRTGPIIAGHIGYSPDQPVFTYDLAKAEEEFKLAWDGELWEKGFYLIVTYNTGNDQRRAAAEILEQNIESINPKFKVSVLDIPWPTYLKEMVASRLPIFFIGWIEDYHHPHNWVHPYLYSKGTFAGWQSLPEDLQAELDERVERCVKLAGDEAKACYEELQVFAHENAIDLFLTQPIGRHYEQLWVKGWYYNPAYFGFYFYPLSKG